MTITQRLIIATLALVIVACGVATVREAPLDLDTGALPTQPPLAPTPPAVRGGGASTAVPCDPFSGLDAALILIHVFEDNLTARQQLVADVNLDGAVTVSDAQLVLRRAVGLISSFPATVECNSFAAFFPAPKLECGATGVVEPGINPDGSCRRGAITVDLTDPTKPVDRPGCDFEAMAYGDVTGNWPCS